MMYNREIVYLSAKEAGFDFLRNFLCLTENDLLCTEFDCAIVDEAENLSLLSMVNAALEEQFLLDHQCVIGGENELLIGTI